MSVEVIEYGNDVVSISEMKCGDIAEIVDWNGYEDNRGVLIQRYKDCLIAIGCSARHGYSTAFETSAEKLLVRILPKGTTIRICDGKK